MAKNNIIRDIPENRKIIKLFVGSFKNSVSNQDVDKFIGQWGLISTMIKSLKKGKGLKHSKVKGESEPAKKVPAGCGRECLDEKTGKCKTCNEIKRVRDDYPHRPNYVEDEWETLPLEGKTAKKSLLEAVVKNSLKEQKKS